MARVTNRRNSVAEAGLEHTSKASKKTPLSKTGGAESGAVVAPNPDLDPNLAWIIRAWQSLSDEERQKIQQNMPQSQDAPDHN